MDERYPLYAPEVLELLQTKAFFDAPRNRAFKAGNINFTAETMGMRGLIYTRALRIFAEERQKGKFLAPDAFIKRGIAKLALERAPEVSGLARELAVINTAEHTLADQEASFFGGLKPHQHPYLHDIVRFMNKAPSKIEVPGYGEQYVRGATIEAPTGVGKTVLIARTMVALGVGRQLEDLEGAHDRVRALLIVPSQDLVEQSTGKVGDDTLRRFAPGIDVGAYYAHAKDVHTDVVAITIDQFVEQFRDGQLHGQRFDVCIIDEAHHATEPRFQDALLTHWRSGPILGFTATPRYYESKDVRNLLPYRIFHGDILDYIQSDEDVLNAAQLFMVRVLYDPYLSMELLAQFREQGMTQTDIDQYVIREATADFLEPFIAEGRRGIVFCEQGGGKLSAYALAMAERLSELARPDGTSARTVTAGSLNNGKRPHRDDSNAGIRRRYRKREIDIITTVKWGTEALNEDIDFVVVACDVISVLKMLQTLGRGTRLSEQFPTTVYGHIFVPATYRRAVSMFSALGLEEVEQGLIIGVKRRPGESDEDFKKRVCEETGGDPLQRFPDRMRALLADIDKKTVATALLHPDVYAPVPDDYIPFQIIIEGLPGKPPSILRHLREEKGYASIGRYEKGRVFVQYFEPAAAEYAAQFRGAVARVDLQRKFGGVDVSIVDDLAAETDATELMWPYVNGGQTVVHYSAEDAAKIEAFFFAVPMAKSTDYNRPKLAAEAGVGESALKFRLTPEEWALAKPRRTKTKNGKWRVMDHWTKEEASPIIARVKDVIERGTLPPSHLVTMGLAMRRVNATRDQITKVAKELYGEMQQLRLGAGRPRNCMPWEVLRQFEQDPGYGVRAEAAHFTIDYSRLPRDENDKNPKRLAYADEILKLLEQTSDEGLPKK